MKMEEYTYLTIQRGERVNVFGDFFSNLAKDLPSPSGSLSTEYDATFSKGYQLMMQVNVPRQFWIPNAAAKPDYRNFIKLKQERPPINPFKINVGAYIDDLVHSTVKPYPMPKNYLAPLDKDRYATGDFFEFKRILLQVQLNAMTGYPILDRIGAVDFTGNISRNFTGKQMWEAAQERNDTTLIAEALSWIRKSRPEWGREGSWITTTPPPTVDHDTNSNTTYSPTANATGAGTPEPPTTAGPSSTASPGQKRRASFSGDLMVQDMTHEEEQDLVSTHALNAVVGHQRRRLDADDSNHATNFWELMTARRLQEEETSATDESGLDLEELWRNGVDSPRTELAELKESWRQMQNLRYPAAALDPYARGTISPKAWLQELDNAYEAQLGNPDM